MNGLGLLIIILFCTITHWGTANYYRAIIKNIHKSYNAKLFEAERMINRK